MSTPSDFSSQRVAILSDDSAQMQETVETSYRSLSGIAVASVLVGVASAVTFLDWSLAIVPVVGMALGWIAIRRVRRNPEESVGLAWARTGIVLSAIGWIGGYGWLTHAYFNQTPAGYEPITFVALQPDRLRPEQRVSEAAEMLDKRKVFLWGFMYPGRQKAGIKEFLLMEDPGTCAYCSPQLKPTQVLRVKLVGGLRTEYTSRMVGIGGELTIHTDPKEEGMGGLVYQIEADCLR